MDATLFEMPAAVQDIDYWRGETCWNCGKGFTEASWDDRHWDNEGHDVHARCCRLLDCRESRIRAKHRKVTP